MNAGALGLGVSTALVIKNTSHQENTYNVGSVNTVEEDDSSSWGGWWKQATRKKKTTPQIRPFFESERDNWNVRGKEDNRSQ